MSKREQREIALAARRAMTPEARAAASAEICARLAALPALRNARTVLSYMALDDEADLSALHEVLLQRGIRLVFPVSPTVSASRTGRIPFSCLRRRSIW